MTALQETLETIGAAYERLEAENERLYGLLDKSFGAMTSYLAYSHVPSARKGLEAMVRELVEAGIEPPEQREPACGHERQIQAAPGKPIMCADCGHRVS